VTDDEAHETETLEESVHALNLAGIDLLISVGMISAIMPQMPAHVKENFQEHVQSLTNHLRNVTDETQFYGEAFDRGIDGDDEEA
jgi:hypothetical protein